MSDLEQLIILPHSTSQHSSTLLIKLHSSSFSLHRYTIIKSTSVNHSISLHYQFHSILAIPQTTTLLFTQFLPIFTPQCFSLLIHCESTCLHPLHLIPTQLKDSLMEQRTSPTPHFSHQILIGMLSLIRHNLNSLTIHNPLLNSLSNVSIHQYPPCQCLS